MKVDYQSERHIKKFHVAHQSRFMDGQNRFNGFHFYQQAGSNQNIKPQRFLKSQSFVLDRNELLTDRRHLPELKLAEQTSLINTFQQSWTKHAVYLDGRPNHVTR
jgi:hypothetical protein